MKIFEKIDNLIFRFFLLFLKGHKNDLRNMKNKMLDNFYSRTKIKYIMEGGKTSYGNGTETLVLNGEAKLTAYESKEVIYSRYYKKEFGEPSPETLSSLKEDKKSSIKGYKFDRGQQMKKFEYVFLGFTGFIFFKFLLPEITSRIEDLLSAYIPHIVMYIYYTTLSVCYFLISRIMQSVKGKRRKSYRNYLILLYLENVYSHKTNQEVTTSKEITYDKDGFPLDLNSGSLSDLVTIIIGKILLIILALCGIIIFA